MLTDRHRHVENVSLIWVDANAKKSSTDVQHTLEKLRVVINDVHLFSNIFESIRFVEKIQREKIFVITSGSFGEELVRRLHSFEQIEAFYIFCYNVERHRFWTKNWPKIELVDNRIDSICTALEKSVKTTNENLLAMTFLPTKKKFDENQLNSSFMYTQLLKKILIGIEYDEKHRKNFIEISREYYRENPYELKILDEFQRNYEMSKAIWWYTKNCFLYQMLNRALRLVEVETIIDMAFFLHDLHRNIERLYREQIVKYLSNGETLTLYRGQSLTRAEFVEMENSQGGLLSFNSFLSTSRNRSVAQSRAEEMMKKSNQIGILFILNIDPRTCKTPFADIQKESVFDIEAEILFSMHTVFRIGTIRSIGRLYQIHLTLNDDDDQELRRLTREIDEDIEGNSGHERLTALLIRMSENSLAERLCLKYLNEKPDERAKAIYFYQLGRIKNDQEQFHLALNYLSQALSIEQRISSPLTLHLARLYNSFGISYSKMNDSSNALIFYKKNLEILLKISSDKPERLVTAYNNIGGVYRTMRNYSKAMEYYTLAQRTCQTNLSSQHPSLAICYFNIAIVQQDQGDFVHCRRGFEKALEIWKRSLPLNHPNIRLVVQCLNDLNSNK